jgi:hypothetical protein
MYRVFVEKPEGKKQIGRPGLDERIILRWIIGKLNVRGWIDLVQDRDR